MSRLPLAAFADRFPAHMKEWVEKLATDLEKAAGDKLEGELQEPVGDYPGSGKLRASRTISIGKSGLRLGWTAVHSVFIDIGRIRSKQFTRKLKSGGRSKPHSRLLGSDKAQEGFTRPAIAKLRQGWDAVVQAAGKGEGE